MAILNYVEQLTRRPETVKRGHVDALTRHGLGDEAVTDIVLVTSCFAFMNRLADGLGVTLEASRYEFAETVFGSESLAKHLEWGAQRSPTGDQSS
ncbi:MAG: hypothetical protein VYA30_15100 [Myxococcota bacterium]|nr:hypothetical protein [Myxococcota bacterium]